MCIAQAHSTQRLSANHADSPNHNTMLNNQTAVFYNDQHMKLHKRAWLHVSRPRVALWLLSNGDQMGMLIPDLGVSLCWCQVQPTALIDIACAREQSMCCTARTIANLQLNALYDLCAISHTYGCLSLEPRLLNHLDITGTQFECTVTKSCVIPAANYCRCKD